MFTNIRFRFSMFFLIIISSPILCPVSSSAQEKKKEDSKAGSDIPAIAEMVIKMLDESEKSGGGFSERDGEYLGDLIQSLSDSGDMRAKEALLKAMVNPSIGGGIILEGLFNLGPQVIPDIIEAIDNTENIIGKAGAIGALQYIAGKDTNKTFFSDKDKKEIKEKLVPYLSHDNEIIRQNSVCAIAYFGDASVVPLLEKIKDNDTKQWKNGTYPIREAAEQAISTINNESKKEETSRGLIIGVADSNGKIVPFAGYDSGEWGYPWPQEQDNRKKMYKRTEEIPVWYEPLVEFPEKWNAIYPDGKTGTMEISEPASVYVMCSDVWGLIGEDSKKGNRFRSTNYYELWSDDYLLATTVQQPGSGMKAPDRQSDEYLEIYKLVDGTISSLELSRKLPVPAGAREAVKTELTNIVRNQTALDGCFIYYVEASKNYKDDNKDNPLDHYVSYFNGWILKGDNSLSFIKQDFEIIENEMFVPGETPIGILKLDGRTYWVFSRVVYEGEVWFILDVSTSEITTVLKVFAGGC